MIKTRPWLQGAGLAMLYLLPLIAIFLTPTQDGLYHQAMPITSLTRGALLDLLALGLLVGAGLAWLNTVTSSLLRRLLWIPILFVTAWCAERGVAEYMRNLAIGRRPPDWAAHIPWFVLALALVLLLFARRYYDIAVAAAEVFLISAGIAAATVILPRLVIASFNHAPPEQASFTHPVRQPWHAGEPRVIWILFDELSYRQAFEHPQPGIDLPAFNRLKQESVTFSRLAPVGILTKLAIPSLFLGQPISQVRSNRQAALLWRSSPDAGWQGFNPNSTIFAAARLRGWSTGVAGWYNPYCRILASTLDWCYWTNQEFAGGGRFSRLSSQRSALENARNGLPFMTQIDDAWHHTPSSQSHKGDYQSVLKQAMLLIKDEDIRFAFIHLPVPHPPGIFPDPTHLGAGREDYLGNLVFADLALAQLRAAIAATSAASDTTLIVSSDHSWRVQIWRGGPGWTTAEEHASNGGVFDPRPVLMVHFPQQTTAEQIDRPESAMIVHSLLLDLIQGKVHNPEEWLATLPSIAGDRPPEEISEQK